MRDYYPLLLLPAAAIIGFAILYFEDRYYRRHPEKERPEGSPWP